MFKRLEGITITESYVFEIAVLFQRLGPRYEMQYWLKFVRHRCS